MYSMEQAARRWERASGPLALRDERLATGAQTHVHECVGSTMLAGMDESRHNHRFAGATTPMIPAGISHTHGLVVRTDFLNHCHEISATTGPAIPVSADKHVHFVDTVTTMDNNHAHHVIFATLVLGPLVPS